MTEIATGYLPPPAQHEICIDIGVGITQGEILAV